MGFSGASWAPGSECVLVKITAVSEPSRKVAYSCGYYTSAMEPYIGSCIGGCGNWSSYWLSGAYPNGWANKPVKRHALKTTIAWIDGHVTPENPDELANNSFWVK